VSTNGHILVVDDDPNIRELIEEYLTEEGFHVSLAADGEAMRQEMLKAAENDRENIDLIILDVRLPGTDGLSLATEVRKTSDAGIIMLSQKAELVDRVAGLEVGADDYLPKPFHLRELLARIHSVLRRRYTRANEPGDVEKLSPTKLIFSGSTFDRGTRLLAGIDGQPTKLSPGETDLLLTFLEHSGRALTRERILDLARGRDAEPFDRSVDVQVGRLRRKIEANPKSPQLIKTVRGIGYMFDQEVRMA